jgi:TRAP-type mannitol/chloroaromatic compound transport system substrate-binding protein
MRDASLPTIRPHPLRHQQEFAKLGSPFDDSSRGGLFRFRNCSGELIRTFGKLSKEVFVDTAAKDPLTRKVYESYMAFLAGVMDWAELSETGYRDTRRFALG